MNVYVLETRKLIFEVTKEEGENDRFHFKVRHRHFVKPDYCSPCKASLDKAKWVHLRQRA